jgi:hypothetical protein
LYHNFLTRQYLNIVAGSGTAAAKEDRSLILFCGCRAAVNPQKTLFYP